MTKVVAEAVVLSMLYVASLGFIVVDATRRQEHKELTNKVALYNYKPVGNGGALAEMNGRTSEDRKVMYQEIEQSYQYAESMSNAQLKEAYQRLESGYSVMGMFQ